MSMAVGMGKAVAESAAAKPLVPRRRNNLCIFMKYEATDCHGKIDDNG